MKLLITCRLVKCESHASEMDNIIQETKEFFEGACNSLLINADKDPIIDDKLHTRP
uniref:Uncharacterized protein n=1 Tax=Rhizophagus irregularis (strain DAOM 181602 / DAOM 197198 / MUCL 43194) TaxID=747089 RepID=U9UZW9_RHIID